MDLNTASHLLPIVRRCALPHGIQGHQLQLHKAGLQRALKTQQPIVPVWKRDIFRKGVDGSIVKWGPGCAGWCQLRSWVRFLCDFRQALSFLQACQLKRTVSPTHRRLCQHGDNLRTLLWGRGSRTSKTFQSLESRSPTSRDYFIHSASKNYLMNTCYVDNAGWTTRKLPFADSYLSIRDGI